MSNEGLWWRGPVVWWQPVEGQRHALPPEIKPRPGQERETLCGLAVTLIDPSEVDWLVPTCDDCMALAVERSEQRREQAKSRESELQATIRRLAGEQR